MSITVNGAAHPLPAPLTISAFLQDNGYGDKLVAVAVNGQFVPRSKHGSAQIQSGDAVEIVAPMQGG